MFLFMFNVMGSGVCGVLYGVSLCRLLCSGRLLRERVIFFMLGGV